MQLLGAVPNDAGRVEFRVWAPSAGRVAVRLERRDHELSRSEGGTWEGRAPARQGRKREFASFDGFSGQLPDPQAEETFLRSKLSRREVPGMRDHYRKLLSRR